MARREGEMGVMTKTRAAALLAAYGASPQRWPQEERAALEAWARANPTDFANMACVETALDAALSMDVRAGADDAALAARILATAPEGDPEGNVVRPVFGRTGDAAAWWRPAAALAACAVLGLVIGFNGVQPRDDIAFEADAAFGAAFDLPVAGVNDGAGG